jgi:hypothetical protein
VLTPERQEGESWGSWAGRVSDHNRALRPADHGHDGHAAFFDGLLADCPGCELLFVSAPARGTSQKDPSDGAS